jgi:transposase
LIASGSEDLCSKKSKQMASKPITMETLLEVIKLSETGCRIKEIQRRTGLARNTIRKYLRLLGDRSRAGLPTSELAAILYESDSTTARSERYNQLVTHFKNSCGDLRSTGVTRELLWVEYRDAFPNGYGYSQYCEHLKSFLNRQDVVMHLEHIPGQEMMIDFAGDKSYYIDTATGELIGCEVFVATLPFSGLTFCIAVYHQRIEDVAFCMGEAVRYFGGISKIVLGDNMKTLVTKTDRYEPDFTALCHQLSQHYGNVFQAARPAEPRDKAMVESHVRFVYRQVYAPLRKRLFYSIDEINAAFRQRMDIMNNKPYKNSTFSRWSLYEQQEKKHMLSLPSQTFVIKKKTTLTVQRNYHIQLWEDHHYYSVPYIHVGKKVTVLYDQRTVEIYLNHERIAIHQRTSQRSCYHTQTDHMPSGHQHVALQRGFTSEDFLLKAGKIGPSTLAAIELVLKSSFYPEQNYKSCNGVLMLEKKYGSERLEAACTRVLLGTRVNYTMIRNILHNGMDKQPATPGHTPVVIHDNIRGSKHYQ